MKKLKRIPLLILPLLLAGCPEGVVPLNMVNNPRQLVTNAPPRFVPVSYTFYRLGPGGLSVYEIKDNEGSNDFVVFSDNGVSVQPISRVPKKVEDDWRKR